MMKLKFDNHTIQSKHPMPGSVVPLTNVFFKFRQEEIKRPLECMVRTLLLFKTNLITMLMMVDDDPDLVSNQKQKSMITDQGRLLGPPL